jgi:hypothetical protein
VEFEAYGACPALRYSHEELKKSELTRGLRVDPMLSAALADPPQGAPFELARERQTGRAR